MKKSLYILGELEDSDIEWILAVGQKDRIKAGIVLIEEGVPFDAMYLILDGTFSISLQGAQGQKIASLGAGEILGEISYVDSRPPSATATAEEDSMILRLARIDILAKLRTDIGFASRFYRALAVFLSDRLRSTISRLGYGETDSLDEDTEYEDELDMDVLDKINKAGIRFQQILRRLRGDQ